MNGGASASLPYSGLVGGTLITRPLNTPPAASRSSCQRSRSAVTVSPLHHHSGTGEYAAGGAAQRADSAVRLWAPAPGELTSEPGPCARAGRGGRRGNAGEVA